MSTSFNRRRKDGRSARDSKWKTPYDEAEGPHLRAIGEFLKPPKPEVVPERRNSLEGTALDELIERSTPAPGHSPPLPWHTRIVLEAAGQLKETMSPDSIRQLRDDLRTAQDSFDRFLKVGKIDVPKQPPPTESLEQWLQQLSEVRAREDVLWEPYRQVDSELGDFERLVRQLEDIVERAGYRWNWETGFLEVSPRASGGRPRQLLRDLVRALLLDYGSTKNTKEVRKRIASELARFFAFDLLDISKGSTLYNAIDNALRNP